MSPLILIFCLTLMRTLSASDGIILSKDYQKNSTFQWQMATKSLEIFPFRKNDHVLDIGCGDGKITALIASLASHGKVVGLDISKSMIKQAASQYKRSNLSFVQANAIHIPFYERFDKIVCFNTFHWIQDQVQALQSIKRSLKPGGKLLLVGAIESPNVIGKLVEKVMHLEKWSHYFSHFKQQWWYPTQEKYTQLLTEAKFEIQHFNVIEDVAHYENKQALMSWIKPLINFIDHLSLSLQQEFIEEIANQAILNNPSQSDGSIQIPYTKLEVIVTKPKKTISKY